MGNGGVRDSFRIQILSTRRPRLRRSAILGLTVSGAARLDDAFDGNHVFRAAPFGALVNRGVDVLVENHLGQAIAVAQVDEDRRRRWSRRRWTQPISSTRLAGVGGAQFAARVSALKVAEKIELNVVSISICQFAAVSRSGDFVPRQFRLLARGHILQRVSARPPSRCRRRSA